MERVKNRHKSWLLRILSRLAQRNCHGEELEDSDDIGLITVLMRKKAPNLTINIPNAIIDPMHVWVCVALGATLQCLVFFFHAYVTYHKKWLRAGARVAWYGFPLWTSGTPSITVGLSICGYVIEHVTTEYVVTPRDPDTECHIVRFQRAVPLMNLPAYEFLHQDTRVLVSQRTFLSGRRSTSDLGENWKDITTDLFLRKKGRMAFLTLTGTEAALSGFILQNLGTRELHFSASVAQLIATITLAIIRS